MMKLVDGCCVTEDAIRGGAAMLISVREAYKYARERIEGDRLAPLSRIGVEDFGEHREKTPTAAARGRASTLRFYCRTVSATPMA
jgi:rhodanese-related sulfurtransferase